MTYNIRQLLNIPFDCEIFFLLLVNTYSLFTFLLLSILIDENSYLKGLKIEKENAYLSKIVKKGDGKKCFYK